MGVDKDTRGGCGAQQESPGHCPGDPTCKRTQHVREDKKALRKWQGPRRVRIPEGQDPRRCEEGPASRLDSLGNEGTGRVAAVPGQGNRTAVRPDKKGERRWGCLARPAPKAFSVGTQFSKPPRH